MSSLKITKKHHRHLNNPFPSAPKSFPFLQGTLFIQSATLTSNKVFPIGKDFQLEWNSRSSGSLTISNRAQPTKVVWSTVPGQAFVSAALAESEIEESRGSFLVKDRQVYMICNHQTIKDIRVIDNTNDLREDEDPDCGSEFLESEQDGLISRQFPVVLITGRIFSKGRKETRDHGSIKNPQLAKDSTYARYRIVFEQKSTGRVGFQVRLGKPHVEFNVR